VHGTFLFFYGRPERLACRLRHGGANSVRLLFGARQWHSSAKCGVCHSRGLWRCHRDTAPDWRCGSVLSVEMLDKAGKAQGNCGDFRQKQQHCVGLGKSLTPGAAADIFLAPSRFDRVLRNGAESSLPTA
jgi:hypothetical protein